jgi:hypothetical protein
LHFKGGITASAVDILVGLIDEGDSLIGSLGAQYIAQGHVLETKVLADIIIIGKVDTSWETRAGKAQDLQRGKVRAEESIFLEVSAPRKLRNHALSTIYECTKGTSALQIDLRIVSKRNE